MPIKSLESWCNILLLNYSSRLVYYTSTILIFIKVENKKLFRVISNKEPVLLGKHKAIFEFTVSIINSQIV